MSLSSLKLAKWHNEPNQWALGADGLDITTDEKTDFWQGTYYGFHPDNGHFLGAEASGNFTAEVGFSGDYEVLYDQAGIMLRQDRYHWIKCGIEYSDGVTNFSCVVTRGQSDWSVIQRPLVSSAQSVRLTRVNNSVLAHYRDEHGCWQLMRLADFVASDVLTVGPMACSPKRAGFKVHFHNFNLGDVPSDPLHGA